MNKQLLGGRLKVITKVTMKVNLKEFVLKQITSYIRSYTIKEKELATMTKNTHDQQVKLTIGRISSPT